MTPGTATGETGPVTQAPQPAYPAPYPAPARAPKRRPSRWWFAVGGLLLVAAIAVAVIAVTTFMGMTHTDGYLPAGGAAHRVSVGSGEHMVFSTNPSASGVRCTPATSPQVLGGGSTTFSINGTTWYPVMSFTTPEATTVSCTNTSQTILRIGGPVSAGRIFASIFGGFAAGGLALLGVLALGVVAILYFTRPPRSVTG